MPVGRGVCTRPTGLPPSVGGRRYRRLTNPGLTSPPNTERTPMSTERRPDARLREHADRLLTGTGWALDTATELAADPTAPAPAHGSSAAAALREGWTLAATSLEPTP